MTAWLSFLILALSTVALVANEKIYAIMITGKDAFHEELAKRSIQSFLLQTYKNKHLIIVNDGEYTFSDLNSNQITEVRPNKKMSLGALRNIGLKAIPDNALWIQWDDDDWHHPKIIEEQYNFLKATGAFAVILKNQVQYSTVKNAAWDRSCRLGICGTLLSRKKNGLYYFPVKKSEDSIFIALLFILERVKIWDNPAYYYLRFIHGNNTWNKKHFNLASRKEDTFDISSESQGYLQEILNQHYAPVFNVKQ